MSKITFFTGQPIFTQVLKFIPRQLVRFLEAKHRSNYYTKKFFAFDHLVTMLYCCFQQCTSIREVITGMQAMGDRLKHLGLKNTPRRSTLSDSNAKRGSEFFEELYHRLLNHFMQNSPDSRIKEHLKKLYIIDSTTISLFKSFMKGAGTFGLDGKKKGGAKAHVVLDAHTNIPVFVRITESRMSDKKFLAHIVLPTNSMVVLDKGYNLYAKYREWTQNKVTYITRVNKGAIYSIIKQNRISKKEKALGAVNDQIIWLGNPETSKKNPLQKARLIRYGVEIKGEVQQFEFLTNDMSCGPSIIAGYYKDRWAIEQFFKSLKQNLPLRYFLGDNENAVRIQIWCCLIADLLLKIILDKVARANKRWSFANLAAMVRLHLSTYVDLLKFLLYPEKALINYKPPDPYYQPRLF